MDSTSVSLSVHVLFSPLFWLSSLLSLSILCLCLSSCSLLSLSSPSFSLYPQLYLLTQTMVECLYVLQPFSFAPWHADQLHVQLVVRNKKLKNKSETSKNRFLSQPVQPSSNLSNLQNNENAKIKAAHQLSLDTSKPKYTQIVCRLTFL